MSRPPGGELPPATPPPSRRYFSIPLVKPRLTYALLAVNILIYILQSLTGADLWFYFGAKINHFIVAGEWWRLITPVFLHADFLHIAFNMYALYIFGVQVEALFGYGRFLITYLLSGVAGSVMSFALSPYPSVGASGAIFGLMGALLIYLYRHRKLFGGRGRRQLMEIVVIAGINLFIGLRPGIDNWGHAGGLLGGLVLAWLIGPIYEIPLESFDNPVLADQNPLAGQRWLAVFAVALALAAITQVIAAVQK